MNKESIKSLLNGVVNPISAISKAMELANCQFGHGLIVRSDPRFVAPKRTASEWSLIFGEEMPKIIKVTKIVNARTYEYEKAVNRQLEKQGGDKTFISSEMSGYDWVVEPIVKRVTKTGELQFCITFKKGDKTEFNPVYVVGDHIATPAELRFIKEHLYVAPPSKKQSELGISEEDVVQVRNYRFTNLIMIGSSPEINQFWDSL